MSTRTTAAILASLVSLAILLTGCARTIVEQTQETDYDPNDITAQLDFWHELPGRSAVSNNEGLHGVILFFEGEDTTVSYEGRVDHLKNKGWLEEKFDEPEDMAMQRGLLSHVLCRAMEIKGGVMMRLTKGNPRYAYKELVYLGVMPDGSGQMVLDGLDYVGVISRAQDWLVVRGLKERAKNIRDAAEAEEKQRQKSEAEIEAEEPTDPSREARDAASETR